VRSSPGDGAHEDDAREAVVAAYRAQLRAMTSSDTGALDELLADDFALTGYAQPKNEWLTQLRGPVRLPPH